MRQNLAGAVMAQTNWLFIGDSLIEFCDWQAKFSQAVVQNLGMAGETVEGLLARLDRQMDRIVPPDLILIMSGINNVAMEDFAFLPAYEIIIERLKTDFPQARIVVNCLLPVRLPWFAEDTVPRVNRLLQQMAGRLSVSYLNIYQRFLDAQQHDAQQHIDTCCFLKDGVHLSDKGYEVWAQALRDFLSAGELPQPSGP
jgi:lysophospholipase L1-like esterase